MAGKRQHYLPQFLQRGFASTIEGRKTWLYRKNVVPREVGFRDVGVEENFYNIEGDSSVDELITEIEREDFVGIIEGARAAPNGDFEPADAVATLIAHLEVRGRHLRITFAELSRRAWNDMLTYFDDSRIASTIIREHIRKNPAELRAMAIRELRSKRLPVHMAPTYAKQVANMILAMPDEVLIDSFWAPVKPFIHAKLESDINSSIKSAHNQRLTQSIAPEVRAQQYRDLRFSIVDVESNDLILGDAAVVFHVSGARDWKPFLDKDDDLIALYLPLTSGRLLVGSAGNDAVESSIIRRQIALTSHTFFISAKESVENVQLSSEIGKAARPLSEDELRSISREVIAGFLPPGFNID